MPGAACGQAASRLPPESEIETNRRDRRAENDETKNYVYAISLLAFLDRAMSKGSSWWEAVLITVGSQLDYRGA
jgi:hypothetical protein